MTYEQLVDAAVALGAMRPRWCGEDIERCWIERAERLLAVCFQSGLSGASQEELNDAIDACDRYSGFRHEIGPSDPAW